MHTLLQTKTLLSQNSCILNIPAIQLYFNQIISPLIQQITITNIQFLLMAKVTHYLPQITNKFICEKGGLHTQESLNLVCLDPLCRNDPMGCCVCFSNTHKYHRVVSVDKFIDDYARNVKQVKTGTNLKKIEKHHQSVKGLIVKIRESVNKQLDDFQQSITQYAQQLRSKTTIRDHISKLMKIELQPSKIKDSRNRSQFQDFLQFILNNSTFDKNNNMIRIADILKQDEERVYALLDKMVNMTQMCQEYIKEVMGNLRFSEDTLKNQKIRFGQTLGQLSTTKDNLDPPKFQEKELLNKTLTKSLQQEKQYWRKTLSKTNDEEARQQFTSKDVKYSFNSLKKHEMIEIKEKSKIGRSNITALKPQYALLTPQVSLMPAQVREWSIQINNCRNFASQNTMAIGLATQKDLKDIKFEGSYPKSVLLLTSQGYIIQNGQSRKTDIIFGTGDVIYCKYDPFYNLLQLSKQNGRKLALKVDKPQGVELYPCVRLTYASDQVQIL